ncbi:unnamed protein product [Lactuca virosa]|uniref:Cytochrome P450 n=1 Tax=Lactuca virosa TaxID=75947 RepID=A0AAU9NUM5_9ASTR|nr:unnamed protein product [Lactuca virosa]
MIELLCAEISAFYINHSILLGIKISWTNKNLPPSPPRLPIIGNLHQLGLNPHRSLEALSKKHGPLMLIHLGNVPMLVASSPEAAKEILKTHDLKFASRPKLRIPDILLYGSNDITFSPYGEYWRQLKSIAVVHLLNNTRVQSFEQVREKEVALMIDKIKNSCGSLVDLNELFFWLTNNIVCMASLGRKYGGSTFADIMDRFMHLLSGFNVGDYIPWLAWIDRLSGLEEKAHKVAKEFDDFLECVVEEHVHKRTEMDAQCREDQDLVDTLLDVQRDNATGFTFHRDVIKALILREGIVRINDFNKQAHDNEDAKGTITTNKTPKGNGKIPLLVPRESTQDVELMGYDIPAGTQAIVNAWAIGRDPTLWEEPQEFRPERFLNTSTDYKGLHFELLPFGGGRRGCPGIQFAIVIIELALANVIYKFDLALPDGVKGKDLDMSEKYGLVVHKKSPLIVVATSRF